MQAVTHAAPMASLKFLNVESSAKYKYAKYCYTYKTEIYSPQYVTFNFQCPLVVFVV